MYVLAAVRSHLYVGARVGLNWRFMWPITIRLCLDVTTFSTDVISSVFYYQPARKH